MKCLHRLIAQDFQFWIIDRGLHLHQAQNRVEKVIVGKGERRFPAQVVFIDLETVSEPENGGDVLLDFRRDQVRQPVKINPIFTKGFTG